MALLAESLVDEWLNRQGLFTVRGIKHGVNEIDLLGVRPDSEGNLEAWHVEVQVSFRPVAYICPIPTEHSDFAKSKTSAKVRPDSIVKAGVEAWLEKKFTSKEKHKTRASAWAGLDWQFKVVHGVVKFPAELDFMRPHGIETIPFHRVLTQLGSGVPGEIKGGAGTDLSDIIEYFYKHSERLRWRAQQTVALAERVARSQHRRGRRACWSKAAGSGRCGSTTRRCAINAGRNRRYGRSTAARSGIQKVGRRAS